jgi:hypothetical protein
MHRDHLCSASLHTFGSATKVAHPPRPTPLRKILVSENVPAQRKVQAGMPPAFADASTLPRTELPLVSRSASALLAALRRALLRTAELLVIERKRGHICAAGSGAMEEPDRR